MEIKVPGLPNSPVIQSSSQRTGNYTVPFSMSAPEIIQYQLKNLAA